MEKELNRLTNTEETRASSTGSRLSRIGTLWGKNFPSFTHLFGTATELPGASLLQPTHMMGQTEQSIRLIPYNDGDGPHQAGLIGILPKGAIAISIKHHSPSPQADAKEKLKFQCTHIQLAVGIDGGAITINNPQDYMEGLFGEKTYPMIFIKPRFPIGVSPEGTKAYIDNIRAWAVIANTFTKFPSNYNGSDPLKCTTKDQILEFGRVLVRALLGDQESIEWLQQPEQLAYCAELAFLALNLGLYAPLNKSFLESDYDNVKSIILQRAFLSRNRNPHISLVDVTLAPDSLKPIDELVQAPVIPGSFWNGLAIQPFQTSDIVIEYIQRSIPRQELGEEKGAKLQATVLQHLRPALEQMLELRNDAARALRDDLLNRTMRIVEKPHASYSEFRQNLNPVLSELAAFSQTHGMAYIPPHCFLLRATDSIKNAQRTGMLEWDYLGHGIHKSVLG